MNFTCMIEYYVKRVAGIAIFRYLIIMSRAQKLHIDTDLTHINNLFGVHHHMLKQTSDKKIKLLAPFSTELSI
jgi:hypothetical protein